MFDRRLIQYFGWGLLGITLLLGLFGLGTVYSAVTAGANASKVLYVKQLIWFATGLVFMVVSVLINYKVLERWAPEIYLLCVVSLVAVLFFGKDAGGSRRWLLLGPITVQPSELAKIAVIAILARYYAKLVNVGGLTIRELFYPLGLILLPFFLIVRQPDLGTAILLLVITGSMTIFVKVERRSLLFIVASLMVALPSTWFFLTGYQKQRILTFLNPDRDPLGAGYHIIQSKIAIGSGMIFGKGFLKGTQNALSFLPEEHTDFIFSILAEEWGFIGSAVLLVVFLLLISWGLKIA
ncbi:MAG: FtsW/RodA/SpoVE family cell cycle protein, partial [Desulfobacterales bacterium]